MQKSEMIKILERIANAYPAFRPSDPGGMSDLWIEKLGAYADEIIREAADMAITPPQRYFPSLPEMIEFCSKLLRERINLLNVEWQALKYNTQFDEKHWREVAAGYRRYGWHISAKEVEADMERAREWSPARNMEIAKREMEKLAKKLGKVKA